MKKVFQHLTVAMAAVAIIFATNSVKAQSTSTVATSSDNQWRLGIGVDGGLVTGKLHNMYDADLGGTLRLQYSASKNFAVMLTSGYYNFFGKTIQHVAGDDNDTQYSSYGMIPVKAGFKVFNGGWYFSGEAGAGFETSAFGAVKVGSTTVVDPEPGQKNVKLLLSPGLGWAGKSWDVGARWESISGQDENFGMVNLRIAYSFGL